MTGNLVSTASISNRSQKCKIDYATVSDARKISYTSIKFPADNNYFNIIYRAKFPTYQKRLFITLLIMRRDKRRQCHMISHDPDHMIT